MLLYYIDTDLVHHSCRRTQRDNPGRVHGSGLIPFRKIGRLLQLPGSAPRAAFDHRRQLNSFPYIKKARSLRAQQPFMARRRQQVDMLLLYIYMHMSRALGPVHHEQNPVSHRKAPCLRKRHLRSRDIRCCRYDYQPGVSSDFLFDVCGIQSSFTAAVYYGKAHAFALQPVQRAHHGIMLHGRGYHVIAGAKDPLKPQVESFRAVFREYHLPGILYIEKPCHGKSRLVYLLSGPCRHEMPGPPGIGAVVFRHVQQCFDHFRRLRIRGRSVIQINHIHTSEINAKKKYRLWIDILSLY